MNWLLPEQLGALTELQSVCSRQGADVVIIGAAAYRAWLRDAGRYTEDIDVAVAIDLEELTQLAESLAALGWRRDERAEHRWHTPAGARVDLLPAGRKLRAAGHIEWPRSAAVMRLVGFEHVFALAVAREVAQGISLRVVPVPVLVLLKIASFLDSPYTRQKDAQDLASIFCDYEIDGDRRFDQEVYDAGMDYDRAGAFLLGQDLAALCTPDEAALVTRFVEKAGDESTPEATIFTLAFARPAFDSAAERRRGMMEAFAAGFWKVRKGSMSR